MSTTAPIPPIIPEVTPAQPAPSVAPAAPLQNTVEQMVASQAQAAQPLEDQPGLRLVIEEDKATGSYIYKTVDPRTGKVISQIPREQLLTIRENLNYAPGQVIDSHS